MQSFIGETIFDPTVAIAEVRSCVYGDSVVARAVERTASALGWSNERGALGNVIPPGSRVVVKPNLVLHRNEGPGGIEPLVTHPSLIRAAVMAALDAGAAQVVVGDAPIQSCDLELLLRETGLDIWAADLQKREPRFRGIRDFRRTKCVMVGGAVRVAEEELQPLDRFLLFDLAEESFLEKVTDDKAPFRVTWYDPRLMAETHRRGKHQYLVAKEILDADVVINLPKLKTHKKAGVTCALKNLIGINGNKEYLPHHRMGGEAQGGDCYPGSSAVKRALERVADRRNLTTSRLEGFFWWGVTVLLSRVTRIRNDQLGVEGSWAGNDTIWRTCLDLNRILLYGNSEGGMSSEPQRRVIHLVDAVIAGQGDGPLAPDPLAMGLILAGQNAAAIDWLGAQLLGYDPAKIPIVREAFHTFRWALVSTDPESIKLKGDWGTGPADDILASRASGDPVNQPIGWRSAAAAKRVERPKSLV